MFRSPSDNHQEIHIKQAHKNKDELPNCLKFQSLKIVDIIKFISTIFKG